MGVPRLVRSNRLGRRGDRRGRIRELPTNGKSFVRQSALNDPSMASLDSKLRGNNQFKQPTLHEKPPGAKRKLQHACSDIPRGISRVTEAEVDERSPLRRQEELTSLRW